ncbi:CHAP domain-containing protein [Actinomadura xylanilytica]|uniref:CHAP domain-containing protein n=1 Tax=Actinomadura xylanilytica TaxID=887459 RepID=UPI00255AFAB5|nr:CHAP domain-containing protein [Actinomadura xylanilytica]MDL4773923.1 CHAP domain-containing protein [Actinomadura xylanilytica]
MRWTVITAATVMAGGLFSPMASAATAPAAAPGPVQAAACDKPCDRTIKDDYPYKSTPNVRDPWNFWTGQCTSFVAWRINKRLGIKFTNAYKDVLWGNAKDWDDAAKKAGMKVDGKPKVGDIAVWNSGTYGHIAYVASIDGTKIVVEEYNYSKPLAYTKRTIAADTVDNFIHFF